MSFSGKLIRSVTSIVGGAFSGHGDEAKNLIDTSILVDMADPIKHLKISTLSEMQGERNDRAGRDAFATIDKDRERIQMTARIQCVDPHRPQLQEFLESQWADQERAAAKRFTPQRLANQMGKF